MIGVNKTSISYYFSSDNIPKKLSFKKKDLLSKTTLIEYNN